MEPAFLTFRYFVPPAAPVLTLVQFRVVGITVIDAVWLTFTSIVTVLLASAKTPALAVIDTSKITVNNRFLLFVVFGISLHFFLVK